MGWRVFGWILALLVSAPLMAQTTPVDEGTSRYIARDFVVGCRLKPERFQQQRLWRLLPVDTVTSFPFSMSRLDRLNVDELLVLGQLPARRGAVIPPGMNWAYVFRLEQAPALKKFVVDWGESFVPVLNRSPSSIDSFERDGKDFLKLPAGTFFAPQRVFGELRFTDRDGQPAPHGIHIGREYDYRGYVEGGSLSAGIFRFGKIRPEWLTQGLQLELRPDVFKTYCRGDQPSLITLQLRNPQTGLTSSPRRVAVDSYGRYRVNIPRKVEVADRAEPAELLGDLIEDGNLEVILRGKEEGVYFGVAGRDLCIIKPSWEYAVAAGREVLVAQQLATLSQMLEAREPLAGGLAKQLDSQSGDLVVAVTASEQGPHVAARRLLTPLFRQTNYISGLCSGLKSLMLSVDADRTLAIKLEASYATERDAAQSQRLLMLLRSRLRELAEEHLGDRLHRLDAINSLASMVTNGLTLRYPESDTPESRQREGQLLELIDLLLQSFDVTTERSQLRIQFREPQQLEKLLGTAEMAVANLLEIVARDLFAQERFELADEYFARVTGLGAGVAPVWFRRAHQLSYNTSVEFDRFENRYAWVRRGIEVLLEGAEKNPANVDYLLMAARFCGHKVGTSDEREAFRRLFADDLVLQERLGRWIDLEKAHTVEMEINNWRVAQRLVEESIRRMATDQATSTLPAWRVWAQAAEYQAGSAQMYNERGAWRAAMQGWKEVELAYEKLNDLLIPTESGLRVRLRDLPQLIQDERYEEAAIELMAARRRMRQEYWQTRSRAEQSQDIRRVRRWARKADQHYARQELDKAIEWYGKAIGQFDEFHQRRPHQAAIMAGELKGMAVGYRTACQEKGEADESLEKTLQLIEQSLAFSFLQMIEE